MSSDVAIKNIRFSYHGFNLQDSSRMEITSLIDLSANSDSPAIKQLKNTYHNSNEEFYAALVKANRTTSVLFSVFIASRNRWQDLFVPVSTFWWTLDMPNPTTCHKIMLVVIVIFVFLLLDLPSMLFRLITFIPRYFYNKSHSENGQILEDLERASVKKNLKPTAIVIQTNFNFLETKSTEFSLSPKPICESRLQKNLPVKKHYGFDQNGVIKDA